MKQNNQNQIIYFFPYPVIGGVEKNFAMISNYLSIFFRKSYLITTFKINLKINNKIQTIEINKFWSLLSRRLLFIICAIKLFFISAKIKNSIIFSFQGNFYAIVISIILKRKIIIRSNLSPDGWTNSPFKMKIFKFLLSKADLVIVNSSNFQKQMKNKLNINAIKIFNPLNDKELSKFKIYKKKINFFENKTINLINVGRLVLQKNQIEILYALKRLEKLTKNFRLLIIGDGPEKKNLKDFIKKNNLNKCVKIIFVKNPYKYISMSDVFILSSTHEGLPNVLLEAAYFNKYIISSNCQTGPSEIIKDYKYGVLYKKGSDKDLFLKIKKLNKKKLNLNKKKFFSNLTQFNSKKNLEMYHNAVKKLI